MTEKYKSSKDKLVGKIYPNGNIELFLGTRMKLIEANKKYLVEDENGNLCYIFFKEEIIKELNEKMISLLKNGMNIEFEDENSRIFAKR